jgi:arsenate reductase
MLAKIYHNSRCSKSRATLAILEENKIEIEIVNYLEKPPSVMELKSVLVKLAMAPQEVIRFGETVAKDLGLSKKDIRTVDEWVNLMISNPIIIERPIVVVGDRAVIGRPPENVKDLL